jgi:tRNA-uridine 2-sulfurtransferase
VQAARAQEHLSRPCGEGHVPRGASTGAAGGAPCGDLVRISLSVDRGRVADAGFAARGCAMLTAAASAVVALTRGRSVLDAARVGPDRIAAELGGLLPSRRHAAELVADALHRALGGAVRRGRPTTAEPERVLVAMSGGVDSAVAALLCARGGAQVAAVTLELWADRDNDAARSCCSAQAVRVARAVAHDMGVPHFTLDLRAEFRAGVVEPFVQGHRAGLTPNPCVGCNGHVRLDAMLDFADRLGAAALATGHYARVAFDRDGPLLRAGADPAKDQSYMLAAVEPGTLARLRFPLGELRKPAVRELAGAAGLAVATKAESQDLCFLAGTDRRSFLARHGGLRERDGEIIDRRGRVIGGHRGQHDFTVGQRRGIGVAAAEPLYVLAKDPVANRVIVGPRAQLRRSRVAVAGATLRRDGVRVDRVKLRYRSRAVPCRVAGEPAAGRHRRLELEVAEPVEGAAPGQLACLMSGDLVVGHATIAPGA